MTDGNALYADYDAWKGWDRAFAFTPDEAAYFAAELGGAPAGLDLFEIGFGDGAFLGWAQAQGARVSGSELTPAAVAAAEAQNVPLIAPDFEAVGALAPHSLDWVVAFDVFEHLDGATIRAKLAAIDAALRPGGRLLLRFPNGQSPFGLGPQHGDATHVTPLSRAKIEQFAQGTSLKTLRYGGVARPRVGGLPTRLVRGLRYILRDLHKAWLNFLYATDIELEPVVVHVLVKPAERR